MSESVVPNHLRALLQDRKKKDSRPDVRQIICLAPELYSELSDLKAERAARETTDDPIAPDVRAGSKRDSLTSAIAKLEQEIADASVVAVFKAPTASKQAEINAEAEHIDDDDSQGNLRFNRDYVVECFQFFERNRVRIPDADLGPADFDDLVSVMAQGELLSIATKIQVASAGAPEIPFSASQSLLKRR